MDARWQALEAAVSYAESLSKEPLLSEEQTSDPRSEPSRSRKRQAVEAARPLVPRTPPRKGAPRYADAPWHKNKPQHEETATGVYEIPLSTQQQHEEAATAKQEEPQFATGVRYSTPRSANDARAA